MKLPSILRQSSARQIRTKPINEDVAAFPQEWGGWLPAHIGKNRGSLIPICRLSSFKALAQWLKYMRHTFSTYNFINSSTFFWAINKPETSPLKPLVKCNASSRLAKLNTEGLQHRLISLFKTYHAGRALMMVP